MPTITVKIEVDERRLCEYCFNRDSFYNVVSERVYSLESDDAFSDIELISIDGQTPDDWVWER